MASKKQLDVEAFTLCLEQDIKERIVPIEQEYAEERERLVREGRYKDLAVFDALEELENIASSCSDEFVSGSIREVIEALEAVF